MFIEKEKKAELQQWIADGKMEVFFRQEGTKFLKMECVVNLLVFQKINEENVEFQLEC